VFRLALILLPLLGACSVSRAVAPLPKGSGQIITSVGGPITKNLSPAIPLPMTSVGYMHGLNGKTNVYGEFYPTGLAAFGVGGVGGGVATEVFGPDGAKPRLMVEGGLYAYAGNNDEGPPPFAARVFPHAQTTFSWDLKRQVLYAGLDQLIQPFPSFRWHFTPLIGGVARVGRVGFQLEYKWMAWYLDNLPIAAEWAGPFHHGASSVQIGISVALGPHLPSAKGRGEEK